jgi:hypothetical protein
MKIPNVCLSLVFFVILACILAPGNALAQGSPYPTCCTNDTGSEYEALSITSSAQSPELTQESGPLPGYFDDSWTEPDAFPVFAPVPAEDPAREPVLPHAVMERDGNRNNPLRLFTGSLRLN